MWRCRNQWWDFLWVVAQQLQIINYVVEACRTAILPHLPRHFLSHSFLFFSIYRNVRFGQRAKSQPQKKECLRIQCIVWQVVARNGHNGRFHLKQRLYLCSVPRQSRPHSAFPVRCSYATSRWRGREGNYRIVGSWS